MSCGIITEPPISEAQINAELTEPIIPRDETGVVSLDDMFKELIKTTGGGVNEEEQKRCTILIAILLVVATTGLSLWTLRTAITRYNIDVNTLENARKVLEASIQGCDKVEIVAARKISAAYTGIPTCSDATERIEELTVKLQDLAQKVPGFALDSFAKGWGAAMTAAAAICAGLNVCLNRGGKHKKTRKGRKGGKGRKSRKSRKGRKSRKSRRY